MTDAVDFLALWMFFMGLVAGFASGIMAGVMLADWLNERSS